jgi:hypothetical protein
MLFTLLGKKGEVVLGSIAIVRATHLYVRGSLVPTQSYEQARQGSVYYPADARELVYPHSILSVPSPCCIASWTGNQF